MERMYNVCDLRVAVVYMDPDNDIDQSSSVDEILNYEHTQLYALTDFFKAVNDEEVDGVYWSFLIDIKRKIDFNGVNMDGIHQDIQE